MTMTSDTPSAFSGTAQRFQMKDGQRPITFMGRELASADSQYGDEKRWTELTLYMTSGGKYVLEKVGRSDVFHSPLCRRKSKGKEYADLNAALDDILTDDDEDCEPKDRFVPCEDCTPDYDVTPAWVEQDIPTVAVHESTDELMKSLYHRDVGTSRFLSRVARDLLEKAALVDSAIAEFMNKPTDVT